MKTYGYCRTSTQKQNLERQVSNIQAEFPGVIIIKEQFTGTTTNRPVWNKLMNVVEPGDTIVFDEVSRMSRNATEGFQLYQDLFQKGVNLVFLKERHIDTSVYQDAISSNSIPNTNTDVDVILEGVRQYLMLVAKRQIEIAFEQAEKEVDHLHQRTKEGVLKAKERWLNEELNGQPHLKNKPGGQIGQKRETKKSVVMKENILKLSKSFNGTLTDKEVIDLVKIDRHTYYKYKKELVTE